MKIKYVGAAVAREITKKDFKANDVEQDSVVWSAENGFVASVSSAAGNWLLESDPDSFKKVSGE
jgi:hypothetical protein